MTRPIPYDKWPAKKRKRELIVEHWFGRDLMASARDYAWERISPTASRKARNLAQKAALDAIYGVMMLLDGVTSTRIDASHAVQYLLLGRVIELNKPDGADVLEQYEIAPGGDGLCMGFHGWVEGDFGES